MKMKNLAILLTAVLIAALAVPAMAADIELSGEVTTELNLEKANAEDSAVTFTGGGKAKVDLGFKAEGGEEKVASIGIDAITVEDTGGFASGWADDEGDGIQLKLNSAYIETVGSLWDGGDEFTTRLGSVDGSYSGYIANGISGPGFKVEGFNLGILPVTVNVMSIFEQVDNGTQLQHTANVAHTLSYLEGDAPVMDDLGNKEKKLTGIMYTAGGAEYYDVDGTWYQVRKLDGKDYFEAVDAPTDPVNVQYTGAVYEDPDGTRHYWVDDKNEWIELDADGRFEYTEAGHDANPEDIASYPDVVLTKVNATDLENVWAINLAGAFGALDAGVTFVNYKQAGTVDNILDMAVEASLYPAENLEVDLAYAQEGADKATALKGTAELVVNDDLTLSAGYRTVDGTYDARYLEKDGDGNPVPHDLNTGVSFGADATVMGFGVDAKYDQGIADKEIALTLTKDLPMGVSATLTTGYNLGEGGGPVENKLALTQEMDLGMVTLSNALNFTKPVDDEMTWDANVQPSTTVSLLALQDVSLTGYLGTAKGAEQLDYGVKASYAAANGIEFSAGYANFVNDDLGYKDAMWAKAGMTVTF